MILSSLPSKAKPPFGGSRPLSTRGISTFLLYSLPRSFSRVPTILVMHFQMTKRAYEQMLAITAGSELRVRPSHAGEATGTAR
jgi:hypothetical protein